VDRGELNKSLLDELEAMPNVNFFFNHKLVGADFRRNLAWFERQGTASTQKSIVGKPIVAEIEISFNFMIGADGAHSAVRYHLMKFARMSYQQEYIDTLWCEFHIPAKETASGPEFRLSPNHLHIWPGGSFMFIAIPSIDKTFTATLFLSASKFLELDKDPNSVIPFFKKNFPGVIPNLITETEIIQQYKSNSHLPLISIGCNPYHFSSSVVILGDAAHAMVPFYGQGMNAGLEDVRVLYDHLDANPMDLGEALAAYTSFRYPDASAICDLALANYTEMSSHVRSPLYLLRKLVEEQLNAYVPGLGWATQYSRVSFGNERYSDVRKEGKRQQTILRGLGMLFTGSLVGGAVFLAWKLRRH
jgi:kynurenine 3-monooxygenase